MLKTLGMLLVLIYNNTVFAAHTLRDIHGHEIPLASLKGKWVYINYWASWCGPCLEEIPELNRFYNRYKSQNVVMLGVNYDALPLYEQKQLVREIGIKYPNLSEDPSSFFHIRDIRGVPVTFVFNPDGKLRKTLYGPQTIETLQRVMS
ncbi:TlpA disulfide reductase family protein [Legionella impletisoli]|nr:TlpA disulfide reductase family protein [Legionella impletisoli]